MPRPLYALSNSKDSNPLKRGTGHAGLWFDKYCDTWTSDFTLKDTKKSRGSSRDSASDQDSKNPKFTWLQTLTEEDDGRVGDAELIKEATSRRIRLVTARQGECKVFKTESRFVTGLGLSNPLETGFAWHPTLGTPFWPGSSLKGFLRSWAREGVGHIGQPTPPGSPQRVSQQQPVIKERLEEIFGAPGREGRLIMLDVLPVDRVRLEADVMTPHYGGWDENNPPADWRSPIPVPFLTTAAGNSFVFSLIPTRPEYRNLLEEAWDWLTEALDWAGAGAKTAVGYGRFGWDSAETNTLQEGLKEENAQRERALRQKEALTSPEMRWRLEIESLSEEKLLERIRIHLEKEPLPDPAERAAFARAVAQTGLSGLWRRGQKKDPRTHLGEKMLKERAKLLEAALKADKPAP